MPASRPTFSHRCPSSQVTVLGPGPGHLGGGKVLHSEAMPSESPA